ncbi:nuclease, partial [Escherichia coli]|nr:nuclease [Escherichia coli]
LYVKGKSNPKAPDEVNVTFSGKGGSFTAVFIKDQKALIHGFRPRARITIRKQDIDESQFEIDTGIKIIPGSPQDLSALTVLLNEEESFARAIELIAAPEDVQVQEPLTLQLKDTFARLDRQKLEPSLIEVLEIPTVKLWRAILDTETESYPNIEISGEVVPVADAHGELLLPYS